MLATTAAAGEDRHALRRGEYALRVSLAVSADGPAGDGDGEPDDDSGGHADSETGLVAGEMYARPLGHPDRR